MRQLKRKTNKKEMKWLKLRNEVKFSMKFEMNGKKWTIKEVNQDDFWKDEGKEKEYGNYHFGRTFFQTQEIWLDNAISQEQKKKTLIHELVHCYIGCYIAFTGFDNCNEDFWCDIYCNSFDIITKIVEDYFEKDKIVVINGTNVTINGNNLPETVDTPTITW